MSGTSSEKRHLDSIREELREAGRMATAFQRRQALARFHVPDLDSRVPGCRHNGLAVGRKIARIDPITAMFFEMSGNTFVVVVYASPPLSGERT